MRQHFFTDRIQIDTQILISTMQMLQMRICNALTDNAQTMDQIRNQLEFMATCHFVIRHRQRVSCVKKKVRRV